MKYASLLSIGSCAPQRVMTNDDWAKIVDTSDEWIYERTGIKERRFAENSQAASDLGIEAAKVALERANLTAKDIDALIVATMSPDYLCMPSTACMVARGLGIVGKPAFDILAACSGFIYLLYLAKALIESGTHKYVLIVGAEKISSLLDFSDRSTCVLFGDGAGAAVIGPCEDREESILYVKTHSDGSYYDLLMTPGCGSRFPASTAVLAEHKQFLKMKGNEVFKLAVRTLVKDVRDILQHNSITQESIDYFIPHQANFRIIQMVGKTLGFPEDKIALSVHKYGNTSSASIPMAINDLYEEGKIKKGSRLLLDAFGGGLTWGSAIVHFNGSVGKD